MPPSPAICPLCNDISSHIYIGNLIVDVRNIEIEEVFNAFGPVKRVWVARNPKARGFAFVSFFNYEDAKMAVENMDGKFVFGSYIKVEISTNKALEEWNRRRDIKPLLPELSSRPEFNRYSLSPISSSVSQARSISPTLRYRSRSPVRSTRRRSPIYDLSRSRSTSPFSKLNYYPRRRSPSSHKTPLRKYPSRRSPSPIITSARPHRENTAFSYNSTARPSTSSVSPYSEVNTLAACTLQPMNNTKILANPTPITRMMPYIPSYPNGYQTEFNKLSATYVVPNTMNSMMVPNQSYGITMISPALSTITRPNMCVGRVQRPYPSQQFSSILSTSYPSIAPLTRCSLPVPTFPPPTTLASATISGFGMIRNSLPKTQAKT